MAQPVVALIGAEFEENLSLRYLMGAVQGHGFDARLYAFNTAGQRAGVVDAVLGSGAIVVGISVPFQVRAAELLSVAADLRERGYRGHIIAGGHFATFEYESLLRQFPAIDSVARHEGEDTFREVCELVRDGQPVGPIAGLVVRDGAGVQVGCKRPLPKLDSLAFPVREGDAHDVLGVLCSPLVGSRGCYADCSFCCIYAYAENAQGARYRMRSPEDVVREMHEEYVQRGVRLFVFHDDNFFLPYNPTNRKRYERFAELMRGAGMDDVALVIKCRPNDVEPELFALLKSMGMIRAYIGIETNSDEGVISLNRHITPDDNRRALGILRDLEIYHSFNVLIFDPEATLEGVRANLDFMADFADSPFNFCRAEVYAGTPLKEMLETQGRLRGNYLAWGYEMRQPRVELLFRIASTIFAARNFKPDGVANLNMGIRFDNEVFRRFYPQAWDRAWDDRLKGFSRRVGEDSVGHMRRALAFVETADLGDHDTVKQFALAAARELARKDLAFLTEVKTLRREMEARIRAVDGRGIHHGIEGRFGQGMPAWAAETGRLGTSVGLELSTELLPVPSEAH